MFERGELRHAFLYEALGNKLLWQIEAEMRGGHFPTVAKHFAEYVEGIIRRETDRLPPAEAILLTAREQQVFDRIYEWLYERSPATLLDTLATIKEQTMARLNLCRTDYAAIQDITANLNNELFTLMTKANAVRLNYEVYAKAFVAFRNDSNLDNGDEFEGQIPSPDIGFMERMVRFMREVPSHTMRARFAAHIMDACIDWCFCKLEIELRPRADAIFDEARECFETAIAAENHPLSMARLLLELEDTLANIGEPDGELRDVLDAAATVVKDRLSAQEYHRTTTAAEFMTREMK